MLLVRGVSDKTAFLRTGYGDVYSEEPGSYASLGFFCLRSPSLGCMEEGGTRSKGTLFKTIRPPLTVIR